MQYEDRFQYPLLLAILLIILEFFISEKRRNRDIKENENA